MRCGSGRFRRCRRKLHRHGGFLPVRPVRELVGEFIRSDRDTFVLSTKYTLGSGAKSTLSRLGNSRKNMVRSVEDSLGVSRPTVSISIGHTTPMTRPPSRRLSGLRRPGPRRQDPLRRPVELSRLAHRPRRHPGRAARVGADRGHPGRIQPRRAQRRSGAAADGRSPRSRRRAVVAVGWRVPDREVPRRQRRPVVRARASRPHRDRRAQDGYTRRRARRRCGSRGDPGPGRDRLAAPARRVSATALVPIIGPRTARSSTTIPARSP